MKRSVRTYYVTKWWHMRGVVALDLEPADGGDHLFNWNLPHGRKLSFYGKLGGSVFATRAQAAEAVAKKAATKLREIERRHAKQLALLNRVITEGVDAVFPPSVQP